MNLTNVLTAVAVDEAGLTAEELARACSVQTHWVMERVDAGLLGSTTTVVTTLRFCSPDLTRARRLQAIERNFDANPELAALTVDLIEEVERLRRRLGAG